MITPRFRPGWPLDKPFRLKSHPGLAMAVHPPEVPAPGRGSPVSFAANNGYSRSFAGSHGRPVTCRSRSCMSHRMRQRTGRLLNVHAVVRCARSRHGARPQSREAGSHGRPPAEVGAMEYVRVVNNSRPSTPNAFGTHADENELPTRSAFRLTVGQAIRSFLIRCQSQPEQEMGQGEEY